MNADTLLTCPNISVSENRISISVKKEKPFFHVSISFMYAMPFMRYLLHRLNTIFFQQFFKFQRKPDVSFHFQSSSHECGCCIQVSLQQFPEVFSIQA